MCALVVYTCVCDKSGLCLYIFITMCSVKIYNQCPRKRRKTENDADPYTLKAMKTTIRNSESPTSLANRLGQRLRERRDSQLQRKTSLEPSLGFSKPPTGLRHGLKELVNHWWVVVHACIKPGSKYDTGAASIAASIVSIMREVFFTSQILFLMSNFLTIWLVGHWVANAGNTMLE